MGGLTDNLSVHEFACKCEDECTHKEVVHMPLALAMQAAADYFVEQYNAERVIVNISCGNRCPDHNIHVQIKDTGKTYHEAKKSKSTHVRCIGADHTISVVVMGEKHEIEPQELYEYYDDTHFNSCGVGLYSWGVHLDMRLNKARW